jgi:microcystin-dependent protein
MDPFVAEIRIFPFIFAPTGWALCNGQLMPISQNTALFSLLGTLYGGNGTSTFALPNLQGMAPLQVGRSTSGTTFIQGQTGGEQSMTLTQSQMPAHTHAVTGSSNGGDLSSPANGVWTIPSAGRNLKMYDPNPATTTSMNGAALASAGGNQAHNNMMPYVVLSFCIALQGVFPPRP